MWRGLIAMLLGACAFDPAALSLDSAEGDDALSADPDAALGDTSAPPPDLGRFGAPARAPVDTGWNDDDPSLTDDGLEIFFGSDAGPGSDEDIWTARRDTVEQAFGAPEMVVELASTSDDTTMKISGDGLTIVFTRVEASAELYIATRPSRTATWETPRPIYELNTANGEWSPYLLGDGLTLVYSTDLAGNEEIYAATRPSLGAAFGAPTHVASLGTLDDESDPMMPTPDVIFFTRDYPGSADSDVFMAHRVAGWEFGSAVRLDELTTPHHDRDPWVSSDLRTVWFMSTRDASNDLFVATR
jgi:hypothetical protein